MSGTGLPLGPKWPFTSQKLAGLSRTRLQQLPSGGPLTIRTGRKRSTSNDDDLRSATHSRVLVQSVVDLSSPSFVDLSRFSHPRSAGRYHGAIRHAVRITPTSQCRDDAGRKIWPRLQGQKKQDERRRKGWKNA